MLSTNPNQEWFDSLQQRFPKVYPEYPNCGVWVLDGWKPIIEELSEQINNYLIANEIDNFKVDQIKEKFWELRFYHSHPLNFDIQKMINDASAKLNNVCTVCGKSGRRYQDSEGRFHRMCEDHINELGNK